MWKKIVKTLSFPLGALFGIGIVQLLDGFAQEYLAEWYKMLDALVIGAIYGVAAVLFGALFYFISNSVIKWMEKTIISVEKGFSGMPLKELMLCISGFLVGIVIAFLVSLPLLIFLKNAFISLSISFVLYILFGMIGVRVARSKTNDIRPEAASANRYVLDSSVIIDGRVVEIINLGFLSGEIIISNMVLGEIRRIADSEDVLKRARGRRGLDMLAKLQEMKQVNLSIDQSSGDEDIDDKLVKLAERKKADLVTNDYNLSRIGMLQNVKVLNLNDLSNAVKPVMLPGEEMKLQIVKDGKEPGQGVAYLEDGTMIVVEGGRRFIGQEVDCIVTSVLQTSAGRMIFAKIKDI